MGGQGGREGGRERGRDGGREGGMEGEREGWREGYTLGSTCYCSGLITGATITIPHQLESAPFSLVSDNLPSLALGQALTVHQAPLGTPRMQGQPLEL